MFSKTRFEVANFPRSPAKKRIENPLRREEFPSLSKKRERERNRETAVRSPRAGDFRWIDAAITRPVFSDLRRSSIDSSARRIGSFHRGESVSLSGEPADRYTKTVDLFSTRFQFPASKIPFDLDLEDQSPYGATLVRTTKL